MTDIQSFSLYALLTILNITVFMCIYFTARANLLANRTAAFVDQFIDKTAVIRQFFQRWSNLPPSEQDEVRRILREKMNGTR